MLDQLLQRQIRALSLCYMLLAEVLLWERSRSEEEEPREKIEPKMKCSSKNKLPFMILNPQEQTAGKCTFLQRKLSRRPPDYSSNLCPPKTFAI